MFNFADIVKTLVAEDALIQVADTEELIASVIRLSEDYDLREQLGLKAKALVEKNRGALARHLEIIAQLA